MRRAFTTLSTLLAFLAFAPASALAKPDDDGVKTEHGVNRTKLVKQAEKIVEERNGITVTRIASCGPVKKNGKPNFAKWVCGWRAEGFYPGQVPYACAGKARWKRKCNIWIVDKCENQRQPEAPLLDAPEPPPRVRLQRQLDLPVDPGAQHASRKRAPRSPGPAFRGAASRPIRARSTGTAPTCSTTTFSTAASARSGCCRRPLLGAGRPAGVRERQGQRSP